MQYPDNPTPLIDADILRYEIGYAAEAGWRMVTGDPDALPEFEYVKDLLHLRLQTICNELWTTTAPKLYMTEGRTFRYDVARKKPYKGQRKEDKPWHFNNLTVYLREVMKANVVRGIEADDQLAIDHLREAGRTVLVSRDKDLRQVPGWFYSWELGAQPAFGPVFITNPGCIKLVARNKLTGTGLAFFYSQVLSGDTADNIPGLPGCGPVKAAAILQAATAQVEKSGGDVARAMLEAVIGAYRAHYKHTWKRELLEQGRLCWLVRRTTYGDKLQGSPIPEWPVMWKIGMIE